MEISENDPFHPIRVEDYPKLFDYVLTVNGLIFFNKLKRKYYLGKNLSQDEYNKLRLLYVYYATSNKNVKEVVLWQKLCWDLDQQKIFEKNMFWSKENLIQQHLILKNPKYVEGLFKKHIDVMKNQK